MIRRWQAMSLTVVLSGLVLTAATAEAVPISGGIGFSGSYAPVTNWQTVSSIDIVNNQAIVNCTPLIPCTGDFATFNSNALQLATYNDLTSFDPLAGPIAPLWSFGGFSFNLTNVVSIERGLNGLVLYGFGVLSGPAGFDPTPADWSFSTDQSTQSFRFSSTTSAPRQVVPDSGSTVLLLGAAMLGLAFAQRRLARG